MRSILFLTQRLPFPPTKGEKIRSWAILSHLITRGYHVHAACLIDRTEDLLYVDTLRQKLVELHTVRIRPLQGYLRALMGLMTGHAMSFRFFTDKRLRNWIVEERKRHQFDAVFIASSNMGHYLDLLSDLPVFYDFMDVDSAKWADYAKTRPWPLSLLYAHEAKIVAMEEGRAGAIARKIAFVSIAEAELFQQLHPQLKKRVIALPNGCDPYNPAADDFPTTPYAPTIGSGPILSFVGTMDYWPNEQAVCWFARNVFPTIRERFKNVHFAIIGTSPGKKVRALEKIPGVIVTGRVEDVRPWVAYASLSIAPMQIARGVQNKVLEAMAMGKATVISSKAATGLPKGLDRHAEIADTPKQWVETICALLDNPDRMLKMGHHARNHTKEELSWDHTLEAVDCFLEEIQPAHASGSSPNDDSSF